MGRLLLAGMLPLWMPGCSEIEAGERTHAGNPVQVRDVQVQDECQDVDVEAVRCRRF